MKKYLNLSALAILLMAFLFLNVQSLLAYENEVKNISSALADNIIKANKKTAAVVDFTDLQGNVTELGRFLAEELSVALSESGKGFEVIDRTHLKSLLKEHQIALTGLIDPKTARKLGKIAGVHVIVTGTITPFGDSIRLAVKALDTETAKIIGASRTDIPKTKAIEELLLRGIEAESYIQATPTPSKPQSKAGSRVYMEGFAFELKHCKVSTDGSVNCLVTTTNIEDKDKKISIGATSGGLGGWGGYPPPTYLYDNEGRQYLASNVRFGALPESAYAEQRLSPQVPVLVAFKFIDVSPSAQSVTLRLGCVNPEKNKYFAPVLRNIPLTR